MTCCGFGALASSTMRSLTWCANAGRGPLPRGLLAESLAFADAARGSSIARHTVTIGAGIYEEVRAYLDGVDATTLADHLIGGLTAQEGQELLRAGGVKEAGQGQLAKRSLVASAMEPDDFILRPLPNSYFTRDPSAWIYGGVSSIRCTGRPRLEALNVEAVYASIPTSAMRGSRSGTRARAKASPSAARAAKAGTSCSSATGRSRSG